MSPETPDEPVITGTLLRQSSDTTATTEFGNFFWHVAGFRKYSAGFPITSKSELLRVQLPWQPRQSSDTTPFTPVIDRFLRQG
jgi:hypothetical protein